MKWYCEKCATIHDDNELCPKIILQLKTIKIYWEKQLVLLLLQGNII